MAKPNNQPKPTPKPPPHKVVFRTTGGPNSGYKGHEHSGKNPHGKRNR